MEAIRVEISLCQTYAHESYSAQLGKEHCNDNRTLRNQIIGGSEA